MPRGNPSNLRPNRKGQPRRGGRAPGTPNKSTVLVKDAMLGAFNDIGGQEALATWAKKQANRKAFYALASKLIPTEITGAGGSDLFRKAEVHLYMPGNNRPSPADIEKAQQDAQGKKP